MHKYANVPDMKLEQKVAGIFKNVLGLENEETVIHEIGVKVELLGHAR